MLTPCRVGPHHPPTGGSVRQWSFCPRRRGSSILRLRPGTEGREMRDERGTHSVGRRVHPRASSLLRAKLRPPPKPNHYVRRARLLELLDATAAASVIVVVSPAGSGKTSLLSGWLDERAASAAWLALDEGDRDGVQFWRGVLAAIGSVRPHSCERASALLQQGTDLGDVVTQLLDDLDSTPAETLLLVIDDVHLVDSDDSIAASLELFVRYLPT